MTRVGLANGRLRVEILGWHKLWAFKSRLDVPLEHVVEVRLIKDEGWLGRGLRMPGTCLPGVIKAGSYYQFGTGEWTFWDVCQLQKAMVIELRDERYVRLVIEVEDPHRAIENVVAAAALAGLHF